MNIAYLSIGSNIARRRNLARCLELLDQRFASLSCSRVFRSAAVGFDGRDFFNMAAAIRSNLAPDALNDQLKAIEDELGRCRDRPSFSDRVIDVDLLVYGDFRGIFGAGLTLPRPEILNHAFVLQPLADLAPDARHPEDGRTFGALWQAMDPGKGLPEARFDWPRSLTARRPSASRVAPLQGL